MATNTGACPKCGQINSYSSVNCIECGDRLPWADVATKAATTSSVAAASPVASALTQVLPATPPQATVAPSGPVTCPKCTSTDVLKVSGIHSSGTTQTKGRTTGVGYSPGTGIGVGVAGNKGTATSLLAKQLAPPPNISAGLAGVGMIMFLMSLGMLALGYFSSDAGMYPIAAVTFGIGVLEFIAAYFVMPRQFPKYERWNALYYCSRCDVVFDPGSGKAVAASEARQLWV